jgi:molybdopterin synthase catalytic subunit
MMGVAADNRVADKIIVQDADFDVAKEYQGLLHQDSQAGAVVMFVGLVRDFSQNSQVQGLYLEHYPAMTNLALQAIVADARQRWVLQQVSLIHRIGYLAAAEQIVLVAVSAKHRQEAFAAAEFIMDFLKVKAPFWKKEITSNGDVWVEAKKSDEEAKDRW